MKRVLPLLGALLAIAVLGGLPNLLLAKKYGVSMGDGTYFPYHFDEFHKMAEVAVAMKGRLLVGNPFLREEASAPASNTPYAGSLFAIALRLTGTRLDTTTWLFDFLVPAFALVLVAWLFGRLFPDASRPARLLAAFLFVLVFLMAPTQRAMMRFMQAQMTAPYFIYLYVATILLAMRRVGRTEFALLVILNACGPWIDLWFALVVSATQTGLLLWHLLNRRFEEAGQFALLVAAVLAGGVPEYLRLLALAREPGFALLTARQGAIATFLPSYPKYLAWLAAFAILAAAAGKARLLKGRGELVTTAVITLLACTGIYFQNLVTGKRLYFQGEHLAGKALVPAGLVLAAALLGLMGRLRSRAARAAVGGALVAAAVAHHVVEVPKPMGLAAPADAKDIIYGYDQMRNQVQYATAFRWLRANAPDTAVVLCDPMLDLILKLQADKFAYSSQGAVHISLDQEGLNRRLYPLLWMRSTLRTPTPEDPVWRMHEHLEDYNARDYNLAYCSAGNTLPHQARVNAWLKARGRSPVFDEERSRAEFQANIDRLYDGFESFLSERGLSARDTAIARPGTRPAAGLRDLLAYGCDYVLWGPQERLFWNDYDPGADATLEPAWSDPATGTAIYRFRVEG